MGKFSKVRALKELPSGTFVFIDSNIFTYFLLDDRNYFLPCRDFLKRIENGEIIGFINNIVISETLFNYTVDRIAKKEGIDPGGVVRKTKTNPRLISKTDISEVKEIFSLSNLYLISPRPKVVIEGLKKAHSKNLLSNDALHLLTLQSFELEDIATNDMDFKGIERLKIWRPSKSA